jgi:hypothetical protein
VGPEITYRYPHSPALMPRPAVCQTIRCPSGEDAAMNCSVSLRAQDPYPSDHGKPQEVTRCAGCQQGLEARKQGGASSFHLQCDRQEKVASYSVPREFRAQELEPELLPTWSR